MGCTMFTGLTGNFALPRQTGAATATWNTETNDPARSGHGSPVPEFQEILFLNIISAVIVDETRNLFVERDYGPPAEGAARFPTTRWTIVMRAALSQVQWRQSALAGWCRLYYYPLDIFAGRHGYSPAEIFGHQRRAAVLCSCGVPGATLFLPGAPLVPRRQGTGALQGIARQWPQAPAFDEKIHAFLRSADHNRKTLGP